MSFLTDFESHLPRNLLRKFNDLDTPFAVQEYLDSLPYIGEERDRSPLNVMLDGQCHCLDGGFLAALCLWRIGFKPLLTDLLPAPGMDDDHVLALYRIDGRWGAVAKSNYVNLGFREPVYKSLRELVMTYFEWYTNFDKQKSLRGYTRPLDLSHFDENWMWSDDGIRQVSRRLYSCKSIPLISPEMAVTLHTADERSYLANTQGTDFGWVYGVRPS